MFAFIKKLFQKTPTVEERLQGLVQAIQDAAQGRNPYALNNWCTEAEKTLTPEILDQLIGMPKNTHVPNLARILTACIEHQLPIDDIKQLLAVFDTKTIQNTIRLSYAVLAALMGRYPDRKSNDAFYRFFMECYQHHSSKQLSAHLCNFFDVVSVDTELGQRQLGNLLKIIQDFCALDTASATEAEYAFREKLIEALTMDPFEKAGSLATQTPLHHAARRLPPALFASFYDARKGLSDEMLGVLVKPILQFEVENSYAKWKYGGEGTETFLLRLAKYQSAAALDRVLFLVPDLDLGKLLGHQDSPLFLRTLPQDKNPDDERPKYDIEMASVFSYLLLRWQYSSSSDEREEVLRKLHLIIQTLTDEELNETIQTGKWYGFTLEPYGRSVCTKECNIPVYLLLADLPQTPEHLSEEERQAAADLFTTVVQRCSAATLITGLDCVSEGPRSHCLETDLNLQEGIRSSADEWEGKHTALDAILRSQPSKGALAFLQKLTKTEAGRFALNQAFLTSASIFFPYYYQPSRYSLKYIDTMRPKFFNSTALYVMFARQSEAVIDMVWDQLSLATQRQLAHGGYWFTRNAIENNTLFSKEAKQRYQEKLQWAATLKGDPNVVKETDRWNFFLKNLSTYVSGDKVWAENDAFLMELFHRYEKLLWRHDRHNAAKRSELLALKARFYHRKGEEEKAHAVYRNITVPAVLAPQDHAAMARAFFTAKQFEGNPIYSYRGVCHAYLAMTQNPFVDQEDKTLLNQDKNACKDTMQLMQGFLGGIGVEPYSYLQGRVHTANRDLKHRERSYQNTWKALKGMQVTLGEDGQTNLMLKDAWLSEQIQKLNAHFYQRRLKHVGLFAKSFKRIHINAARKDQLEILMSVADVGCDEKVQLGALLTISKAVSKERNVFQSEMQRQVDKILSVYAGQKGTIDKEACLNAYRVAKQNDSLNDLGSNHTFNAMNHR